MIFSLVTNRNIPCMCGELINNDGFLCYMLQTALFKFWDFFSLFPMILYVN